MDNTEVAKVFEKECKILADTVKRLFQKCLEYPNCSIIIITNAEEGWVQLCTKVFRFFF